MLRCEEWCKIFVKVRERGLNLEAAAAILKPSCSQATGPLESRRWPESDPSRANEVRSGRGQGATKEYTLTAALRRCDVYVILISTSSPCLRHSYSHVIPMSTSFLFPRYLHVHVILTSCRDEERRLTDGKCLLLLLVSVLFLFCVLPWEVRCVSVSLR